MLQITFELTPVGDEPLEVSHAGFITLRGSEGEANARDLEQPSMVLVDMVQFMSGVRLLFTGDARGFRMMAQGSAFELAFQRTGESTLAIAAMGELIEHGDLTPIARTIHDAAHTLWSHARPHMREDDSAIPDIEAEFAAFETFVAGLD